MIKTTKATNLKEHLTIYASEMIRDLFKVNTNLAFISFVIWNVENIILPFSHNLEFMFWPI
jgi:hypothetical protein